MESVEEVTAVVTSLLFGKPLRMPECSTGYASFSDRALQKGREANPNDLHIWACRALDGWRSPHTGAHKTTIFQISTSWCKTCRVTPVLITKWLLDTTQTDGSAKGQRHHGKGFSGHQVVSQTALRNDQSMDSFLRARSIRSACLSFQQGTAIGFVLEAVAAAVKQCHLMQSDHRHTAHILPLRHGHGLILHQQLEHHTH